MKEEDFKKLANACKTSEEFAERAARLDAGAIYRDMFRKFKAEDIWKEYEKVKKALLERVDCKKLWYETWIDLSEDWPTMWGLLKEMPFDERVEKCATYLNERERFYGSADYTDMLNKMLNSIEE